MGIDLPIDEGTAGFFANTIAPISELQLEQYGRAAEIIARAAAPGLAGRVTCGPVGSAGAGAPAARDAGACVERFIATLGRLTYRRPLTTAELRELGALFDHARADADPIAGMRVVVQALLSSPHFLYLVEPPLPGLAGAPDVAPVGGFALAARLAYFLWDSTPDEPLLAAAEHGELASASGLAAQTRRLMADPRFADTVASFHLQWLDLTELAGVEKRTKLYPLFTPELRAAMREETIHFADHVVRAGDGRLETLLAGGFSFVRGGLYQLYGLGKPAEPVEATDAATDVPVQVHVHVDDDWHRVELAPLRRAGFLTQAAFLTQHAHWDKPSLVLRGKVIRERLLCTVLPPPPPDVNNTPPPFDPKVSMRERFEDHRSEVSCARCHRLIDPLGIPFEGFDAIGAARTMDGPAPVDPTSELAGTARSDGPVKDAAELAQRLAGADEVRDCVVLQWLRYALGRDAEAADAESLARLRGIFRASGQRLPVLIAAIATTDSFRYAKVVR